MPAPGERPRRRAGTVAGVIVAGLAALVFFTTRPADAQLYPAKGPAIDVYVSDNRFHSDLVIPARALAAAADEAGAERVRRVMAQFPGYDHVMLGWGDLQFYTGPATIDWRQAGVGARAALGLNGAGVVHVAMLRGDPRQRLGDHRLVRLRLSRQGLSHLVMRLEATISDPTPLRAGVYGDAGAFFPGSRRVHLFNLCNHWTAELLNAAGAPTHGVLSGVADLLVGDLLWRAGGEPVPQARPDDTQDPAPKDHR